MSRGGKRPGSGRKKGKTQKTLERQAIIDAQIAEGATPLEVMLQVMRDPQFSWDVRLDMAKTCASYIHPRLQAITHSGPGNTPIALAVQMAKTEISALMLELAAKLDEQDAGGEISTKNNAEGPSVAGDAPGEASGSSG